MTQDVSRYTTALSLNISVMEVVKAMQNKGVTVVSPNEQSKVVQELENAPAA